LPYGLKLANFDLADDTHLPANESAEASGLGAFFKKNLDPSLRYVFISDGQFYITVIKECISAGKILSGLQSKLHCQ